jgi:hypothetical protein
VDRTPIEKVAAFLIEEGWLCEQVVDQPILHTVFEGNSRGWHCFAHCRPEIALVLFYSVAPLRVAAVLRPAVAEYLTRANWGLLLGNFEMDYSDGEVRYKTSLQFDQTELTPELLRPLILGNVAVMDKYLPGLQAILSQAQTPLEAINTVENNEGSAHK